MTTNTSSPYGTIAGTALDVIIVVPSPPSRRWRPDDNSATATSTEGDRSSQNKGVIASSDFYVTFPSSVQYASSTNPQTSSSFSMVKVQQWTSFLYSDNNTDGNSDEPSTKVGGKMKKVESDYCVEYSFGSKPANNASSKQSPCASLCVLPPQSTGPKRGNVQIQINGRHIPDFEMKLGANKNIEMTCTFVDGNGLRPPTHALEMLVGEAILNYGRNLIRYILFNEKGEMAATAEAFVYMWSACDYVIVSDIDGTITKSDVRGVIDTVVQDKFSHIHAGVCKLFHDLMNVSDLNKQRMKSGGDVRFFYLSSRPICYIAQTRKLLVGLSQEKTTLENSSVNATKRVGLPPGPIMCHRGTLSTVLHSELVAKNVYEFKADVLARQIVLPFVAAMGDACKKRRGTSEFFDNEYDNKSNTKSYTLETTIDDETDDRLFVAGFGNKITDAKAYELAGMERRDIYIINKESCIKCLGAVQLQRSTTGSSLNFSTISSDYSECPVPDFCCAGEANGHAVQEAPSDDIEISLSERESARNVLEPTHTTADVSYAKPKLRKLMTKSARQAIRAFTSNKSFSSFPSFGSTDLSDERFTGYDDPNLFLAVQERMKRTI